MKNLPPLLLWSLLVASTPVAADEPSFNRDVRPILSDRCFHCHGFDAQHREADLRLDTEEGSRQAITPGSPDESELFRRIASDDPDELMPPPTSHKAKLTAVEREAIRKWIAAGAKYEPHWAFVAPERPAVPPDAGSAIDAFVSRALKEQGLAPNGPARPAALLRRVSLDLTGLPPTRAELDEFERAAASDLEAAYGAAVDRLLASPRFGEHFAIDWLDAARFADTNGYQMDAVRMNWPWRDWVVRAFNENMPFDRFTIEQLAGDLLENPTQDQLVATAFNRNHMLNAEGGTIAEENRTKNVFDRVETTSTVWLGLTMNCCQCHDHKFDPITQRDYYSLFAVFNQLSEPGGVDKRFGKKSYSDSYDNLYMVESPFIMLASPEQLETLQKASKAASDAQKALDDAAEQYRGPFAAWVEEMRANPELIVERIKSDVVQRYVVNAPLDDFKNYGTKLLLREFLLARDEWRPLLDGVDRAREQEDAEREKIPHVMVMRDDKPRETKILLRGNYETPGEKVSPAVPAFLPALPDGAKADRLALAKWLVSPEHPLTTRVTVNRFWQHFFGRGLVKTPDDFGQQGALPTHPQLLDWLAVEFRESGWDVKRLVRSIVVSETYRRDAAVSPDALANDPENVWLARGPRHRLDSRAIRDQALYLAGLLVEKRGGPPVMPYQPPGVWEEMSFGKNRYFQGHGEDLYRRSLYTFWRRSVAPTSFFDVPARQTCSVKPLRTSTPLHALATLNDVTYVEAARVWAERLADEPEETARLRAAYRAATSREADERTLAVLQRQLRKAVDHFTADPDAAAKLIEHGESRRADAFSPVEHAAWTSVCLLILNLDETLNK